jgi:ParB-like chromosome segregation protein Spo0J
VKIGDYDTHPIADAFTLLEGDDFEAFKESVRSQGLLHKHGWLYKGKILDGRNRYRAALDLGVSFRWKEYEGDDPLGHALACNRWRNHMNESQRAISACKLESFTHGGSRRKSAARGLTRADVAKAMNVGERTVAAARVVLDKGVTELLQAVERGEVAVTRAAELAVLPEDQQRPAVQELLSAQKQRKERVQRANNPRQGYGMDAIEAMRTVIMKAAHEAGALVKARPGTDGCVLEVGYRGQGVTITLERIEAS